MTQANCKRYFRSGNVLMGNLARMLRNCFVVLLTTQFYFAPESQLAHAAATEWQCKDISTGDGSILSRNSSQLGLSASEIVVGALARNGEDVMFAELNETFSKYLSEIAGPGLGSKTFRLVALDFDNVYDAVELGCVDFVFANPSVYSCLALGDQVVPLATMVLLSRGYELTKFYGSVIARADRDDITTFQDVRGKIVEAVSPKALGAYKLQKYEMMINGIRIYEEALQVRFPGSQEMVVNDVIEGKADIGFVQADMLPDFRDLGLINMTDIKIIEEKRIDPDYPYNFSTSLAASTWPLAALPHVPTVWNEMILQALLALTRDSPAAVAGKYAGWEIAATYYDTVTLLYSLNGIHDNGTCNLSRSSDSYDDITCSEGSMKVTREALEARCAERGLQDPRQACPEGYDCVCQPCVKIPETEFSLYSTAESAALYTDYGENEVEQGQQLIGHKCEQLEVCAVVPLGGTLQMTIIDNWYYACNMMGLNPIDAIQFRVWNSSLIDEDIGWTHLTPEVDDETVNVLKVAATKNDSLGGNGVHPSRFSMNFTALELGNLILQLRVHREDRHVWTPINFSPVIIKVNRCEGTNRVPDYDSGECICSQDFLEKSGECVMKQSKHSAFVPIVAGLGAAALLIIAIMAVFIHVRIKRSGNLECVIEREELQFDQDAIEVIGQGRFGMVVKAKFRGTTVVVKRAIPPPAAASASRMNLLANRRTSGAFRTSSSSDGIDSQAPMYSSKSRFSNIRLRPSMEFGSDEHKIDINARSPLLRQLTFSNKTVKPIASAEAHLEVPSGLESTAKDQRHRSCVPSESDDVTVNIPAQNIKDGIVTDKPPMSNPEASMKGLKSPVKAWSIYPISAEGTLSGVNDEAIPEEEMKDTEHVPLEDIANLLSRRGNNSIQSWTARTSRSLEQDFMNEVKVMVHLRHPNITTIMGACPRSPQEDPPLLVMEYMQYGSLYEMLHNKMALLDGGMVLRFAKDIATGMNYLHSCKPPVLHNDLKTANVLIDTTFRAKLADFGLSQKKKVHGYVGTYYYMAPELLNLQENTTASDVYAMGMVLFEMFTWQDLYVDQEPEEVSSKVKDLSRRKPHRPVLPPNLPKAVSDLIKECWADYPEDRPDFREISARIDAWQLKDMEEYWDAATQKRTKAISFKAHSSAKTLSKMEVLHKIFPVHVAEALSSGRKVEPEHHDCVTVFFSDIVGFTNISSTLKPVDVMDMLDRLYNKFDKLADKHELFKVETIGDAYMAVANLGQPQLDHAARVAHFATDAVEAAQTVLIQESNPSLGCVNIRVGFHSGPVVASVVGSLNQRYCLFGDTVNIASRMESSSEKNKIHCSEASAKHLQQDASITTISRCPQDIKGKGIMTTYWVEKLHMSDYAASRMLALSLQNQF